MAKEGTRLLIRLLKRGTALMFLLFQSATEKFTGSQSLGFGSFFSYPLGCLTEITNRAVTHYLVRDKVYTLNGKRKNNGGSRAVTCLFDLATNGKNRKNEV